MAGGRNAQWPGQKYVANLKADQSNIHTENKYSAMSWANIRDAKHPWPEEDGVHIINVMGCEHMGQMRRASGQSNSVTARR